MISLRRSCRGYFVFSEKFCSFGPGFTSKVSRLVVVLRGEGLFDDLASLDCRGCHRVLRSPTVLGISIATFDGPMLAATVYRPLTMSPPLPAELPSIGVNAMAPSAAGWPSTSTGRDLAAIGVLLAAAERKQKGSDKADRQMERTDDRHENTGRGKAGNADEASSLPDSTSPPSMVPRAFQALGVTPSL